MDEKRPQRRRELSPQERKNLEKQHEKEKKIAGKQAKRDAKYREEARRKARFEGRDSHIVVEIPARPEPPKKKRRKKSLPDIIERETDKRVRDMDPTDHSDGGYYVNEVGVRKAQAEREREKRRKKQPKPMSPKVRRRRRIIVSILIIVAVMIVGIVLSLTVLFKTEKIVVKNNKYYDDSTVLSFTNVSEGHNIFTAAMFGDTKSISDALPYVKSAKISFEIPSTLIITLENQTPYSSLKSDGSYYLVSEENRILEEVDNKPSDLMFVDAPKLKSTDLGDYVEFEKQNYTDAMDDIMTSLVKHDYKDVTAINLKRISNITLTYDNRILIKLGMPDNLDYKIRTAFTIINTKLDPRNTRMIKGVLNVSNCKSTKRSFWREGAVIEETEKPTKPSTAPSTTEPETEPETEYEFVESATEAWEDYSDDSNDYTWEPDDGSGDYYDDGSGDYYDDGSGDYYDDGSGDYYDDGSGNYYDDGSGDYYDDGSGNYYDDGSGDYSDDVPNYDYSE